MKNFLINRLLSLKMRTKIAFTIFFIILLFSLGVAFIIKDTVFKKTDFIIENSIENLIKVNEAAVLKNLLEENYWNIFKIMNSLKRIDIIQNATFTDKNYKVIASSDPASHPLGSIIRYKKTNDRSIRIPLKSENIIFGYFFVNKELGFLNTLIKDIKNQLLFTMIIAALISILIGYIMSIRIVGRLEVLSDNAKLIEKGRWKEVSYKKSLEKDEISELSVIFYNMLKKIEDMVADEQNMKMFYYDILENLDELVIICDKFMQIKFHNSNKLKNLIIEEKAFTKDVLEVIEKNISQKCESFVLRVQSENKKMLYLHVNLKNVSDDYALSFSNITSIKKLEEQELLKNSFEIIGEISSEVVHEIKNHLLPIKLLLEQDELDYEDRQRVLSIIIKINTLVKNFLKSGRPIDKKMSIDINIKEKIENTLFLYSQKLEEKNIKLFKKIDKFCTVYMAELEFNSILTNLLSNAIDACQSSGNIEIICKKNEKDISLVISNSGNSIDKNIVKNIHKPFFTTKKDGSGMGLYIVYKIVYMHGGLINIESNDIKTTFTINIPHKGAYREYSDN